MQKGKNNSSTTTSKTTGSNSTAYLDNTLFFYSKMPTWKIFIVLSILPLLPGCMGFHYQWHHSKGRFTQSSPTDIEGLWSGSWESSTTKHSGKLRCVVRKTSPDSYSFHYRATWARIISGNFKINCTVTTDNEKWRFSGKKNLGILGGKFSHHGTASLNTIQAIYHSEQGEEGTFELHRPDNQR